MADSFLHAKTPCAECPWRRDVPVGKFPAERYRLLAPTAYDMAVSVFACHMSKDEKPFACAGFLIMSAAHNFSVRMARINIRDAVKSPYPLYETYRRLAIANGVSARDASLKQCRDDAQA